MVAVCYLSSLFYSLDSTSIVSIEISWLVRNTISVDLVYFPLAVLSFGPYLTHGGYLVALSPELDSRNYQEVVVG